MNKTKISIFSFNFLLIILILIPLINNEKYYQHFIILSLLNGWCGIQIYNFIKKDDFEVFGTPMFVSKLNKNSNSVQVLFYNLFGISNIFLSLLIIFMSITITYFPDYFNEFIEITPNLNNELKNE